VSYLSPGEAKSVRDRYGAPSGRHVRKQKNVVYDAKETSALLYPGTLPWHFILPPLPGLKIDAFVRLLLALHFVKSLPQVWGFYALFICSLEEHSLSLVWTYIGILGV
jgi:hypothetical protein